MLRSTTAVFAFVLTLSAAGAFAQQPAPPPTSPLTIHIGDSDFTIGGFMDATAIMRSTNHGSGIGTSFGTIPFDNTAARQSERDALLDTELPADAPGDEQSGQRQPQGLRRSRLSRQRTERHQRDEQREHPPHAAVLGAVHDRQIRVPRGPIVEHAHAEPHRPLAGAWRHLLQPGRRHELPDGAHLGPDDAVPIHRARDRRGDRRDLDSKIPQQYVGSAVVLPAAFPGVEVDCGRV